MKGKRGDHGPVEKAAKTKKSKPHQQAPPLDEVKDFETPTKQEKLLDAEAAQEPVVRNGYLVANFVKPHLERNKDDKAFIAFELSFPLTDEHKNHGLLPSRIIEGWTALTKHGFDKVSVPDVPAQTVELALAPDSIEKQTCLKMPFTEITNVCVLVVQTKGSGEAKDETHLRFRVKTEMASELWRWAAVHFGHIVWLKMSQSQGSLLENEEAA
jgi:hypothetical protein